MIRLLSLNFGGILIILFIILIKANIYTVGVKTEVPGKSPSRFSKWPNQTHSFTGQVLGDVVK
ncbi:hypothetical protein HMPREF0495_01144 [Levilactobacillus brevis ATCC 14869 = DSM 20054]|uniref:Uncharacterized protein n=1 Tax=Levilactobacillus brevis ATCC 14869 = DSM 20054 TaxID=649758 RepID=U2P101_LEVBR|nr:hypothetical protein HMPREF0495_01144 [Levilactobacillus brevis ATCC 14869 = DSM 20054]